MNELAWELGDGDWHYSALRAVLHTLRDPLFVEVTAKLAALLLTLIRGIYYEDWNPGRTQSAIRTADAFLDRVAQEGRMAGETGPR